MSACAASCRTHASNENFGAGCSNHCHSLTSAATLELTGGDDVWVFLNGKLALDIGGIHVPISGSVTIDAAANRVKTQVVEPDMPPLAVHDDAFTAGGVGRLVRERFAFDRPGELR